MTISTALEWAKKLLKSKSVDGPEASAEFLLQQIIGEDKVYIFSHPDQVLTAEQQKQFEEWISRRAKHEPVWYITGKIEFLGLYFTVNQSVLIPRPETELLIEKIAEHIREGFAPKKVLDVGTGSGAIIISLANMLKGKSEYFASDISAEALEVAKENAENLGLSDSICFRLGDLFEPWKGQKFDLIVANLPYVPEADLETLKPDLVNYEPHIALFSGEDGLTLYRKFFQEVGKHLNEHGKIFCEIGYNQGDKIKDILTQVSPSAEVTVLNDYADVDRIVIIEI